MAGLKNKKIQFETVIPMMIYKCLFIFAEEATQP
jgi:hypothetical protein